GTPAPVSSVGGLESSPAFVKLKSPPSGGAVPVSHAARRRNASEPESAVMCDPALRAVLWSRPVVDCDASPSHQRPTKCRPVHQGVGIATTRSKVSCHALAAEAEDELMKILNRSTIPVALSLIAAPVRAAETKEHAKPHWDYGQEHGPEHWGDMDPEYATCKAGHHQSPVDIGATVKADLPPI